MRPVDVRSRLQDFKEDVSHCGLKTILHNKYRFVNAYLRHQIFRVKRYLGVDDKKCDIEGCDNRATYFFPLSPMPDRNSDGENIKVGELSLEDDGDSFDVVKWTGLKKYVVIAECKAHY